MNIEFKKSFARDLKKKAKDANLRIRVQEITSSSMMLIVWMK